MFASLLWTLVSVDLLFSKVLRKEPGNTVVRVRGQSALHRQLALSGHSPAITVMPRKRGETYCSCHKSLRDTWLFLVIVFAVCMDDSGVVCTEYKSVNLGKINGRFTCQSSRRDPRVAEELKFDSSLDVALILISQTLLDSRLVSSSISYITRATI